MKLELYVERKVDVGKEKFEVKVGVAGWEDVGVNSVSVSGKSEEWNMGGRVGVEEVDVTGG
ncbi:hypothetical protein, partial [Paenibacillus xylanexedens]|uniref:hypothetical protein n=1 Tax=Paenibacillus xylanexedens TaxID=528191 RepID=UPI0011A60A8E